MSAVVVATDYPLDHPPMGGNVGRGTVRILADPGTGPVCVARDFRLTADRWLVRGMEVTVSIDPAEPERFEIDWDAIPGIEERVAVNDPTLADPAGAAQRVKDALRAAGLSHAEGGHKASGADGPSRFEQSLANAATQSAPPGTQRAVVLIATLRAKFRGGGGGADGDLGHEIITSGKLRAVLSVHVPGRPPYAVFARRFEQPTDKADLTRAGLPAVVSLTDPDDVEVLWDELPSLGSQLGTRISDAMTAQQAVSDDLTERMAQAMQRAVADGPPDMSAAANPGAASPMGPEWQGMMAANAKRALQFVKDPAQRAMLIAQYRAAGIVVDESDEAS